MQVLLPGEVAVRNGQQAIAAVYFISHGVLEARRAKRTLTLASPGYFGAEVVESGAEAHADTVSAVMHSTLYMLPLEALRAICRHFPREDHLVFSRLRMRAEGDAKRRERATFCGVKAGAEAYAEAEAEGSPTKRADGSRRLA
eukprot:2337926-Pleurochrysis_carterae.AAC.1